MRTLKILMFLCIVLLISSSCSNSTLTDIETDKYLTGLLKDNQYFKLRDELPKAKDKLSKERFLYYKAECSWVFDKKEESNNYIDELLNKHRKHINDSIVSEILSLKASNFYRSYQYKKAAEIYEDMLANYSHALDSNAIDVYEEKYEMYNALSGVAPQQIHKNGDVKINGFISQFGHILLPVRIGVEKDTFLMDTGAGISFLPESYAKKLELPVYNASIGVQTSNDRIEQSKLAVADSFYIGDILFENVVFLVSPDESFKTSGLGFEMNGVVGFPVIYQMGEMDIMNDGTIFIPKEAEDRNLNNLYFLGLECITQMITDNDTLVLRFDTGANITDFFKRYYDKHKEEIENRGELRTVGRGDGSEQMVEEQIYLLRKFPFSIGTKNDTLPFTIVTIADYSVDREYDGNLGMDVLKQSDKMIINFKHMYVDYE